MGSNPKLLSYKLLSTSNPMLLSYKLLPTSSPKLLSNKLLPTSNPKLLSYKLLPLSNPKLPSNKLLPTSNASPSPSGIVNRGQQEASLAVTMRCSAAKKTERQHAEISPALINARMTPARSAPRRLDIPAR